MGSSFGVIEIWPNEVVIESMLLMTDSLEISLLDQLEVWGAV